MLLCTILLNQRGSGLKLWVFGERLGLKKKEKLSLKLNRSLGELHSETCTWYLPMRGPATHIITILISLTHIKYCL